MRAPTRLLLTGLVALMLSLPTTSVQATSVTLWTPSIVHVMNLVYCIVELGPCPEVFDPYSCSDGDVIAYVDDMWTCGSAWDLELQGPPGDAGAAGVGVASVQVNVDGRLEVTLTDGTVTTSELSLLALTSALLQPDITANANDVAALLAENQAQETRIAVLEAALEAWGTAPDCDAGQFMMRTASNSGWECVTAGNLNCDVGSGGALCAFCDDAYHSTAAGCEPNVCTCDHGVVHTGSDCDHGTVSCASCSAGYAGVDCDMCAAHYADAYPDCSTCALGYDIATECTLCAAGYAGAMCDSCDTGYHDNGSICAENVCSCDNGTAAIDAGCATHEAEICDACDTGFADCGNDFTCDDIQYDDSNCGSCGVVCPGAETCNGGVCRAPFIETFNGNGAFAGGVSGDGSVSSFGPAVGSDMGFDLDGWVGHVHGGQGGQAQFGSGVYELRPNQSTWSHVILYREVTTIPAGKDFIATLIVNYSLYNHTFPEFYLVGEDGQKAGIGWGRTNGEACPDQYQYVGVFETGMDNVGFGLGSFDACGGTATVEISRKDGVVTTKFQGVVMGTGSYNGAVTKLGFRSQRAGNASTHIFDIDYAAIMPCDCAADQVCTTAGVCAAAPVFSYEVDENEGMGCNSIRTVCGGIQVEAGHPLVGKTIKQVSFKFRSGSNPQGTLHAYIHPYPGNYGAAPGALGLPTGADYYFNTTVAASTLVDDGSTHWYTWGDGTDAGFTVRVGDMIVVQLASAGGGQPVLIENHGCSSSASCYDPNSFGATSYTGYFEPTPWESDHNVTTLIIAR